MKVKYFITGFFTLLFSTHLYAACELPPAWQNLECQGSYNATELAGLNSYLSSPGIRTVSGVQKAKNLSIQFDVSTQDLNLVTPCSVTVVDGKNLNISGSLCVKAKECKNLKNELNVTNENDFETIKRLRILIYRLCS